MKRCCDILASSDLFLHLVQIKQRTVGNTKEKVRLSVCQPSPTLYSKSVAPPRPGATDLHSASTPSGLWSARQHPVATPRRSQQPSRFWANRNSW
ncbi:hypothetical protein CEXT_265311 [Caerostris extrusa]|uniref:Uncharacterized protein n=1 Tax=Caerostris extrusa TaxID=172846 RepID=A0AAV4X2Q3_CAEEX|nr:hypothetical protein CEXT_265311 [Caerostris extrusa]